MQHILFHEEGIRQDLFPLTLTRHVADLRLGILTIRQKWNMLNYLHNDADTDPIIIQSSILANKYPEIIYTSSSKAPVITYHSIRYPWDLIMANDMAIRTDYYLLTRERISAPIPAGVQVINPENIFIEEGSKIYPCIINAENGPVYIGKNSTVQEGAMIRGPFALCEGAVVKMGAKIYGATTIGPFCVAGGEIKNSIIFEYSNKAHDGYLGDSIIGAWCNLGAGTSNSNLKNTGSPVRIWHQPANHYMTAGNKCGLIMGDYSRAAINTSFNTGTITGICCNIFGNGLTPKFIPSFSWGMEGNEHYEFDKVISNINNWMKFKDLQLNDPDIQSLKHIFDEQQKSK